VRGRVARSRRLVARGRKVAAVARVMQISRQAIYRTPKTRPAAPRRPATGTVDRAIVEVANANPTDGTRMVAALASREIDRPISRKRAQRVMRAEGLLQRHRPSSRRRRPRHFRVERPDHLWHMDMTSVWVAEHGWCNLNAIIDCCTREIPAWGLDLRCRRQEAETVVKAAVAAHGIGPDRLTLGTDNGTAYTSRGFRAHLTGLGITHRRGGYRDPESQAFIESWFSKLKERLVWRSEFETLDEARQAIAAYVETYHHRPHSGLGYRTPKEVRKTWEDAQESEASTKSRGLG
jgi:putative transposase